MVKNRNRAYSNDEIVVVWQARQCTHSTLCYTKLRSVFDPIKRPWINMSGSTTDKILEIVEKCPSMALTFKWVDESRNATEASKKLFTGSLDELLSDCAPQTDNTKAQASQATINIRANGPVVISGNFEVMAENGELKLDNWKMLSLCRCAQSGNMPHCDGTHFKVRFTAK